jgi:hypothetical protein
MRFEILTLALIVGAFTWGFRYLPIRAELLRRAEGGVFGRFLAATGPAAIATLFAASIWPMLPTGPALPLAGGVVAVLAVYWWRPSVILATMAGAAAYGVLSAV